MPGSTDPATSWLDGLLGPTTIQSDGEELEQRTALNFSSDFDAEDDAENGRTNVSLATRSAASAFGTDGVTGQTIAGGGSWTQLVPLGRDDYDRVQVAVGIPNSVAATNQRRLTGHLWVTRDTSEAYAQSPYYHYFSVRGYPSGMLYSTFIPSMRFYSDADDGKLSEGYYQATAAPVRLDSAAIVGSNLELEWKNEHATATATVTNRITWDAYRTAA